MPMSNSLQPECCCPEGGTCFCGSTDDTLYLTIPALGGFGGSPFPTTGTYAMTKTVPGWLATFASLDFTAGLTYYYPSLASVAGGGTDYYYALWCSGGSTSTLVVFTENAAGDLGYAAFYFYTATTDCEDGTPNTCSPISYAGFSNLAGTPGNCGITLKNTA